MSIFEYGFTVGFWTCAGITGLACLGAVVVRQFAPGVWGDE